MRISCVATGGARAYHSMRRNLEFRSNNGSYKSILPIFIPSFLLNVQKMK